MHTDEDIDTFKMFRHTLILPPMGEEGRSGEYQVIMGVHSAHFGGNHTLARSRYALCDF